MEKHGGHDRANEMCVGDVCFVQPYAEYVPPTYYQPVPHREYRWKLSGKIVSRPGFCLRFQHMLPLPNSLGMRDDARWRWQWIPLSLIVGLKIDSMFDGQLEKKSIQVGNCLRQIASESPYVRIKILNPICGNLALQPVLQVLPTPALSVKREFKVAGTRLTVRMKFEANNGSNMLKGHRCMFHINWHPAENASIQGSSVQGLHHVQYSKDFSLTEDCRVVVSAVAKGPSDMLKQGLFKLCESFPLKLKFDSVKISHSIRSKVKRVPPLPPPLYLKSAKHIGNKDVITVVPGHWIDPGVEVGASGEREFNLEVVNVLEKQLRGNGWEVLRPDRDAPLLTWEEYLNWVSKQTLKGIPVLEIHGQGSTADYRGIVLGVIGDAAAPLTKELALNFGYFQMDWRELGVSRRGGVIIESFNADEVLQMAPWHRKWAVRRLSNLIVSSIERAGAKNRAAHKICIDLDPEDDLVQIDKNCLKKQTLLFKQG